MACLLGRLKTDMEKLCSACEEVMQSWACADKSRAEGVGPKVRFPATKLPANWAQGSRAVLAPRLAE
jgi:hypothetical protein